MMKWTIRVLSSPPRLSSLLYMLTCRDVSFSTMSLFLCLLDILKSLILLIFKKKRRLFAAGGRRGICV